MEDELVEQGWTLAPHEGFIEHVGGIWWRERDGLDEYGFIGKAFHGNRSGVVQGGMLMTFADRALGSAARRASGALRSPTISMTTQFMRPMHIGTFGTIRPIVLRVTSAMAFMSGTIICQGIDIVHVQGVWRPIANLDETSWPDAPRPDGKDGS